MMAKQRHFWKNSEVVIAILGLVGVIATATLSNWDKVFGTVVEAKYSGYRPTGNFETEFRYYFDVSGGRQAIESTQQQILLQQKEAYLLENPNDVSYVNSVIDAVEKESIKLDDVIRAVLPVYQKHFTLAEIQELNKFYSTDVMQGMVNKLPLIAQGAAPIQVKMMNDYLERVGARVKELEHKKALQDFLKDIETK